MTYIFYSGLELQRYTNDANWAQDGQVLMKPFSHFNFFVRGLLQLCSYLAQQLPTRYKISIDAEVFLSAFSMVDDAGVRVKGSPWQGAPDGSAYDTHIESADATSESAQLEDDETPTQPTASSEASNSIVVRRQLALKWIDHQEKRYRFLPIPVEKSPNWEEMRNKIVLGPHGARMIKAAKGKDQNGKESIHLLSSHMKSYLI